MLSANIPDKRAPKSSQGKSATNSERFPRDEPDESEPEIHISEESLRRFARALRQASALNGSGSPEAQMEAGRADARAYLAAVQHANSVESQEQKAIREDARKAVAEYSHGARR